ncbi:hypothetical protein GCM10027569_65070 [Flindersiella endophytica]
MPPERNDASRPSWTLIGPAFATIIGLFQLTVVFFGTDPTTPIQLDLGLSGTAFLIQAFLAYLVAAAIAFPLGLRFGARAQTAVTLPAVFLMLAGVLLIAFASGAGLLTAGRVVTGLGAGAAAGVTTALLRTTSRRAVVAAVTAVLGVVAVVIAPFVNQAIASTTSFRLTYLAAVPFVILALLVNAVVGIVLVAARKQPAQPAYVPSTTRR